MDGVWQGEGELVMVAVIGKRGLEDGDTNDVMLHEEPGAKPSGSSGF